MLRTAVRRIAAELQPKYGGPGLGRFCARHCYLVCDSNGAKAIVIFEMEDEVSASAILRAGRLLHGCWKALFASACICAISHVSEEWSAVVKGFR